MYLKKDGVFTSCFIGQILCICKFVVLIVGVVVLRGKNGKVTKSFKHYKFEQQFISSLYKWIKINILNTLTMMFNIAPGYEIATLLFFGLVVVICESNISSVISQLMWKLWLVNLVGHILLVKLKKKIKPINNSLPGSFQGNLLAEHTRFRQCLVLEDVW